jgi:hypothetical protein
LFLPLFVKTVVLLHLLRQQHLLHQLEALTVWQTLKQLNFQKVLRLQLTDDQQRFNNNGY